MQILKTSQMFNVNGGARKQKKRDMLKKWIRPLLGPAISNIF